MIVLDWESAPSIAPGVVLLFGSGLIGGAVADAFRRLVPHIRVERMPWGWPKAEACEILAVEKAARQVLTCRKDARLMVVWAAGRSGFGTSAEGMSLEFRSLDLVCATARRVGAVLPLDRRTFVHVSSAGGLFEGQVACSPEAVPKPLRPYGEGKFLQERAILNDDVLGHRIILRPSSVYGFARGMRRGLVPTLVAAGIQRRTSTIVGTLTTLRDYVYAPDIGRFVAEELLGFCAAAPSAAGARTVLLASGRPASVYEILKLVEARIGTQLHLKVDPRPENARSNTFLHSALPDNFHPTSLEEGVARTATAVIAERNAGWAL